MGATRADFSGYATKADLKCSDGRTITPEAFKHQDKIQVPLVWQHGHSDPANVLGHAILEARPDGMYTRAYFNTTPAGVNAKALVEHKDINAMSIYANQLVEKVVQGGKQVLHGMIREVSLVLAGANPGALIDWVQVAHGDGDFETLTDEAVITTGLELEHDSAEPDGPTVQDVIDSMTDDQRGVMSLIVSQALEAQGGNASHSDDKPDDKSDDTKPAEGDDKPDDKSGDDKGEGDLNHQEGANDVTHNVFDQTGKDSDDKKGHALTHEAVKGIVADAMKPGATLRSAVEDYAVKHGIETVDILFPDPKTLNNTPEFNQRRNEWVQGVWDGTRKSPFSRVKSIVADLTQDEARAKGYIKGEYKKEEWFGVTKRSTTPTTVYKKQKLDRDDIVDITDFDVVAWMKVEMRMMLMEELARAILIGDGRAVDDEDKIKDPMAATDGVGLRSIINEHELYATTVNVNLGTTPNYYGVVESILRARRFYKGTGMPTFYTTSQTLVEMLLSKDTNGRRYWNSPAELAAELMVSSIVEVEVMEDETDLLGIVVNLSDYNVGADKGGEVNLFDDFDIDYNQYKYLIETRISGALVKVKSALIIKTTTPTNQVVAPTSPTFVPSTGVVTIPTLTGVVYTNADTSATLSAGAQTALTAGSTLNVLAIPAAGYYFSTNAEDEWPFKRPSA